VAMDGNGDGPRGAPGRDAWSGDTGLLGPVWAGTAGADLLGDAAWVAAMVEVEVALARAQASLGLIPASAVGPIAAAAGTGLPADRLAAAARRVANPVLALVTALTAAVARIDRDAAQYVHRGSTSQDILDSAGMLLSYRALARVETDLGRVSEALARLAQRHRDTAMAGRTLTQHAVPITFGLKAAGWLAGVLDAIDRVRLVRVRLPVQLGGAAGTLSAFHEYARSAGSAVPDDRAAVVRLIGVLAAQLQLAEPEAPWHTRRTPLADIGWAAVVSTGALGKFAIDVLGMSRTEVDEVSEPAGPSQGASSAMPQKRNPVLATLIASAARQVPAHALLLGQCLLAEDERSAGGWQAEWEPLRQALRLTIGAASTAAELAEGLTVHPDRLGRNLALTGGRIVAERLSAALAPVLGRDAVEDMLARTARDAVEHGRSFADLLAAAPELAHLSQGGTASAGEPSLRDLLDPGQYLGVAAELVDRVLSRARDTRRGGRAPAAPSGGE
jgi:3-carboxy-cis,cis-muconate cycloisomerase